MTLDLTSLENALAQLGTSLDFHASDMAKKDPRLALQFRAAAIHAFEYSYDLSFKMLQRYLKEFDGSPETVMQLPFRDLIRMGAEKGFIEEPTLWFAYRELRNATSHTYSDKKAEQVFSEIPHFKQEADRLLAAFLAYERSRD